MRFKIFENQNLIQGISDASFGSMVGKMRNKRVQRFLKSLGYNLSVKNLVWAEQVFGSKVHICKIDDSGKVIKGVDGLISNIKNQVLSIFSADCLPILLFDPKNKVVAALHGSRESLVKGIIKEAISKLSSNFNSNPRDILVGIGPHIRKCHYWLKEKTYQKLKNTRYKKYFSSPVVIKKPWPRFYNRKVYFDLTKLALDELLKSGVRKNNIEDSGICTYCQSQKYFSARKMEEEKISQRKKLRFASFIGLANQLKISTQNFQKIIKEASQAIKRGEILICPTDTVYGLIADATNKKVVEKLFKIKKRPERKPIPIFVRDLKMAKKFAFINKNQEKILKKFWPGKFTFILKRRGNLSKILFAKEATIGLRIPNYKLVNILLRKLNLPLTGTSANISGKPASIKIKEVLKQFENQKEKPDLVIDAGNLPKNKPSIVIDLTYFPPKILRV